jgi:bifunctional non-homologous end joining protein LigD
VPQAVHQLRIEKRKGGEGYAFGSMIWRVCWGLVEVHPWAAMVDDYEHARSAHLDLDRCAGVQWQSLIEAAFAMRKLLKQEG